MFRFLGLHFSTWAWLLWPFRVLMRIEVRPESINKEKLKQELEGRRVVYVLPRMYVLDAFVLNLSLKRIGLPRAWQDMTIKTQRATLYALKEKPHLLSKNKRDIFVENVKTVLLASKFDKDIVFKPVSIFWGRRVDKVGRSPLRRFLFPEDSQATSFHKILMLLFNLRHIQVYFGESVGVDDAHAESQSRVYLAHQTAKQLKRRLQIEFRRDRALAYGPTLYRRDRVVHTILGSPEIQKMMGEAADSAARHKMKAKVLHYIDEMSADYHPGTINTFETILDAIWTRLFQGVRVRNFESVTEIARTGHILWLPCHRSNFDHLLLVYVLLKRGFIAPHTVAGKNLSFWPLGVFLRRVGSFFIRRTFAGNKLYAQTFAQYVHFLMHQGFPIEWFQEGGRSRVGKLLSPKLGMLSICTSSLLKRKDKNTWIVPVYFGYDRVGEDESYARELLGAKKEKESLWTMIRGIPLLFKKFGYANVAFGKPILFSDAWASYFKETKQLPSEFDDIPKDVSDRDARVQGFVKHLAMQVNERINGVAIASSSAFVAATLVAFTEESVPKNTFDTSLASIYNVTRALAKRCKWGVSVAEEGDGAVEKTLEHMLSSGKARIANEHYVKNTAQTLAQWWYRGTIFHIFAVPGIVAASLLRGQTRAQCIKDFELFRSLWRHEVFWEAEIASENFVEAALASFCDENWIAERDDGFEIKDRERLEFFQRLIQPEVEVYACMFAAALSLETSFSREQVQSLAESIHSSGGANKITIYPLMLTRVLGRRAFDGLAQNGAVVLEQGTLFKVGSRSELHSVLPLDVLLAMEQ